MPRGPTASLRHAVRYHIHRLNLIPFKDRDQFVFALPSVVLHLLGEPRVDHVHHAVNGEASLSDVGGEDNLPGAHRRWLKHFVLII